MDFNNSNRITPHNDTPPHQRSGTTNSLVDRNGDTFMGAPEAFNPPAGWNAASRTRSTDLRPQNQATSPPGSTSALRGQPLLPRPVQSAAATYSDNTTNSLLRPFETFRDWRRGRLNPVTPRRGTTRRERLSPSALENARRLPSMTNYLNTSINPYSRQTYMRPDLVRPVTADNDPYSTSTTSPSPRQRGMPNRGFSELFSAPLATTGVPQLAPLGLAPTTSTTSAQAMGVHSYGTSQAYGESPLHGIQGNGGPLPGRLLVIEPQFGTYIHPDDHHTLARAGYSPSDTAVTFDIEDTPTFRGDAAPNRRKRKVPVAQRKACTACGDEVDVSMLFNLPCQCSYCNDCLNRLVRIGCSSAASFPPKCCRQAVRITSVGPALTKETSDLYKKVEAEFGTRTPHYCAVRTCSAFIPQEQIIESDELAVCGKCNECTCTSCNALFSAHTFDENQERICPKSEEERALSELAAEEDWKRCPACKTMVEKVDGCNHVICNCGVEFCYECGSFFDEENLCGCESEDGDGNIVDDDEQFSNNSDEDNEFEERWPDHRRMYDTMGRQRCYHLDVSPDTEGLLCHGCLKTVLRSEIHSCQDCHAQLCRECVDDIHDEHIKTLELEHENEVRKILLAEPEPTQEPSPFTVRARTESNRALQLYQLGLIMAEKWQVHRARKNETWAQHKVRVGLSH